MADWKVFKFEIPGKDLLEPVRAVLQTLLVFLEILKTILETIKAFLIDFGNPIRALVEALIKLIEELFESLRVTGLFALFDIPDLANDPNFSNHRGGLDQFKARFKASLFDTKDFNRPQPRPGSTTGGFILLAVAATDVSRIVARLEALMKFFGMGWSMPRFAAPANFKVAAIGAGGDPILDVAKVFTDGPIEKIQLQWTLPTTVDSPSPGFGDTFTRLAAEFKPPQWLIEKSEGNPLSEKIELTQMDIPMASGIVTFERPTNFAAGLGGSFEGNEPQLRKEILRDQWGEPVVKFHGYKVVGEASATGLMGITMGRYRFIDTDVEAGKTYYYRVRSFNGKLAVNSSGVLTSPMSDYKQLASGEADKQNVPYFEYPGTNVVMGQASPIVRAAVPVDLGDFDVYESLKNLFLTAFSLDFHQAMLADYKFDDDGFPVPPSTPITGVGRGSLEGLGDGIREIVSYVAVDVLGAAGSIYEAWKPDQYPDSVPPELPWEDGQVRFDSARLAGIVASAMMQLGDVAFSYRALMTGPLPRGAVATGSGHEPSKIRGESTLDDVTAAFTERQHKEGSDVWTTIYTVDLAGAQTFFLGYTDDVELRLNILAAINFIKTFTLGGVPPDWISISPLRDIIPWSADLIYKLLDAIDALLSAFAGVLDEIRAFIDLIIRKINALEALIQVLIDILNFVESLQISANMLVVPSVSGDATAWAQEVDNAGTAALAEGLAPTDYAAGIALAYVAADIAAFQAAFTVIFGAS